MMYQTLEKIIKLNNTGAQHIAEGSSEDAIPSLVEAHDALRDRIGNTSQPDETIPPTGSVSLDMLMMQSQILCSCGSKNDGADYYGVFSRPVKLPQNLQLVDARPDVTVSLVVIFNLGLTLHLQALNTVPRPSQDPQSGRNLLLKKASRMYLTAYKLHFLHEQHSQESGEAPPSRNILLLALMNNCGLINRLLGDDQSADQCFQHLFASLMWLRSTKWWETRVSITSGTETAMFGVFFETVASWVQHQSLIEMGAAAA